MYEQNHNTQSPVKCTPSCPTKPTPTLLFTTNTLSSIPRPSQSNTPDPSLTAKREDDILIGSAHLDLAACRRHARRPDDRRAGILSARDNKLLADKGVAKDVAEVVPDVGAVEVVGKDGLGRARVQA